MELVFTPMRETDLPVVLGIERASFPKPWTNGLFLNELRLDFSRQTVARVDDRIVGYAVWWLVAGEGHILNVAVDPSSRTRGIGRGLVGRILDSARSEAATVVGLEVRAENRAALALYAACGFERVGERRDYYGPGRHAVLMDHRLVE